MKSNEQSYENQQAAIYANFSEDSYSWQYIEMPALDSMIQDLDDHTVALDIGCGNGRVVKYLQGRGIPARNLIGLDSSEDMLKIARESIPGASFILGQAEELPFPKDSFNLITTNMLMHCLGSNEAMKMLRCVGRALSPGGTFVLIDTNPYQDPNKLSLNQWIKKKSPWGAELMVFQHDIMSLLEEASTRFKLKLVTLIEPEIIQEGIDNSAEYKRYSAKHFRIAALMQKL